MDAGYESEEAYVFLEQNGQESYLKPQNYELSRTRKYRQDISRRENMAYDPGTDEYTCSKGKKLKRIYDRHRKNQNGYVSTVTVYECESCKGCPCKDKCIHGNHCRTPMEERNKRLSVSKVMKQKRQEALERITTEYGTQLRMNRSIQAEGSFAVIKEDMNFRRYLYWGKENALAQSVLLAIAYNINKLHFKIQGGRTGQFLTELKAS